jgi:tetratricopeptide (TPR) repeat protein
MRTALLVCLVAALVPLRAQDKSPGYPAYEKANTLFVAQKFPECLKAIDQALRLDPKLVPALTLKAKVAMAQNSFEVARQALERAIKTDSSAWYAHFLYGLQFYLQNEMQSALGPLETARRLNPRESGPVLYLGYTSESLGRLEQAVSLYREAIRLERASGKPQVETLLVSARLLLLLGRLEESEQLIQDALELDPKSRDARFENARLLMKSGEPAQAAREGELALGLPAGVTADRQILYLLVRAYRAAGQENRASERAERLRALDP